MRRKEQIGEQALYVVSISSVSGVNISLLLVLFSSVGELRGSISGVRSY